MLTKFQQDILEDIQNACCDIDDVEYHVSSSQTIEDLKENLWDLIREAKVLVSRAEDLHGLLGVTDDKG
jgi:hypothetical protein